MLKEYEQWDRLKDLHLQFMKAKHITKSLGPLFPSKQARKDPKDVYLPKKKKVKKGKKGRRKFKKLPSSRSSISSS